MRRLRPTDLQSVANERKVFSGEGFATVADVAKPVLGPVLEGPSLE